MFPPQNRNLWFPEEKTEGASFPCSIHGLVRFHSPMKTAWLKNSGYQRYQSVSWWTPFGILPPFAGLEQSHFGWHFFWFRRFRWKHPTFERPALLECSRDMWWHIPNLPKICQMICRDPIHKKKGVSSAAWSEVADGGRWHLPCNPWHPLTHRVSGVSGTDLEGWKTKFILYIYIS